MKHRYPLPPDLTQKMEAAELGLIPSERFAQQTEKVINGELRAATKKKMKTIPFQVVLACSLPLTLLAAQSSTPLKDVDQYENHNQLDYGPLKTSTLRGKVKDSQKVPVPEASVLLFTEKEHKLLATVKTDRTGRFSIAKIGDGRYRLLVKYNGFCTANVPIYKKQVHARRAIMVTMKPSAIDDCSLGKLE